MVPWTVTVLSTAALSPSKSDASKVAVEAWVVAGWDAGLSSAREIAHRSAITVTRPTAEPMGFVRVRAALGISTSLLLGRFFRFQPRHHFAKASSGDFDGVVVVGFVEALEVFE